MQRDTPLPGPDDEYPMDVGSRIRGPSGEELEVAELRVAPADLEKLREVVSARGGAMGPEAERNHLPSTGSIALVHPMDDSGMYLIDFRSSEPGWILGTFTAFRDLQML